MLIAIIVASLLLVSGSWSPMAAQQIVDEAFRPPIATPAYSPGRGPVVLVDESHGNFSSTGRYRPFADLLQRDGYDVRGSPGRVTAELLDSIRVLVTVNAKEAFTAQEVSEIKEWVRAGGAILLIVDHPPVVEPTGDLAAALGIQLRSIGAVDPKIPDETLVFRRSDGTLLDHATTAGIDAVATFSGSCFRLSASAVGWPLLVLGPGVYGYSRPRDPAPVPLSGELQGAVLEFGMGRVGMFAEAAMFSAQVWGPQREPMGMNAPVAAQNAQFLLNVAHWLTGERQVR